MQSVAKTNEEGKMQGVGCDDLVGAPPHRPTIVCLCGSTRFMDAFQQANLAETIAGRIVLSIGCNTKCDADLIALGELTTDAKERLDELHKRKIDLADEVLILNVGGYVGQSTRSELRYAREHGKRVRWLEEQMALEDDGPPIDLTQRLTPADATESPNNSGLPRRVSDVGSDRGLGS